MPTPIPLHPQQGTGFTDHASRGCAGLGSLANQTEFDQAVEARDRIAILLADGEMWTLPLFTRLEAEVARLSAQQDAVARARQIAKAAAQKRIAQ